MESTSTESSQQIVMVESSLQLESMYSGSAMLDNADEEDKAISSTENAHTVTEPRCFEPSVVMNEDLSTVTDTNGIVIDPDPEIAPDATADVQNDIKASVILEEPNLKTEASVLSGPIASTESVAVPDQGHMSVAQDHSLMDPLPTVQKLKIKIPRSMSIPCAPSSAKIEPNGLCLLASAAALCNSLELDQQYQNRTGEDAEDVLDMPSLTITTDAPPRPPVTPKLSSLKRRRAVTEDDGPDEGEEMLKNGTEINGFIYFSTEKSKPALPDSAQAVSIPALTSSGRPTRRAALNNKLIRGGFTADVVNDDDTTYCRPKPKPRPTSIHKTDTSGLEDPEAKLAKVKASLKICTTSIVTDKAASSLPKPMKITATAKQRLGRKLGLK